MLQAWQGYHGNVYFEPIKVHRAQYSHQPDPQQRLHPDSTNCSSELQQALGRRGRHGCRAASSNGRSGLTSAGSDTGGPGYGKNGTLSRGSTRSAFSRNSTKSLQQQHQHQHQRKMAILDKKTVLNTQNDNIHEDIVWIVGQESTGSLSIQTEREPQTRAPRRTFQTGYRDKSRAPHIKNRTQSGKSDRPRICKGSVVHNIQSVILRKRGFPLLSVTGDKFTPPQIPSPLLRTQTQYSQSSQRASINSPDPYHSFSNPDKLPPLEQLRASLRHIDNSANQGPVPMHMIVPPLERMKFEELDPTKNKPFVKYSAEVRNSANAHSLRAQLAK